MIENDENDLGGKRKKRSKILSTADIEQTSTVENEFRTLKSLIPHIADQSEIDGDWAEAAVLLNRATSGSKRV